MTDAGASTRPKGKVGHYFQLLLGYVAPRIASLVVLGLLTRRLRPDEYGRYSLILTYVSISIPILLYWLQSSIPRLLPEHTREGRGSRSLGSAVTVGVVLVALHAPIIALLSADHLRLAAAAWWIGLGLFVLVHSSLVGIDDARLFMWFAAADAACRLLLTVFAIRAHLGLAWIIALPALSGLVLFLLCVVLLRRRKRIEGVVDGTILREFLHYGAPLVVLWIGAALLAQLDRILVFRLAGSTELGRYAAVYPLGDAVIQVFATPFIVQVSNRMFRQDELSRALQIHGQAWRLAVWAFAFLITMAFSTDRFIMRIFLGASFQWTVPALATISLGLAFWSLASLESKVFELEKQPRRLVAAVLLATALNVLANAVLVPRLGGMGAALSTAISYFACLLIVLFMRRRVRALYDLLIALPAVAAGIWAARVQFPTSTMNPWLGLLRAAVVGAVPFLLVMMVTFRFSPPPWRPIKPSTA